MQTHQIARKLAEADALGYEQTTARPSLEHLGMELTDTVENAVICWVGLCGDPEPGWQQVKYTDRNGLCNIYRKRPC
jgi:hypothetical protein